MGDWNRVPRKMDLLWRHEINMKLFEMLLKLQRE